MTGEKSAKIFVCYSRSDVAFADQLSAALRDFGYEVLIDREGTNGGEEWRETLRLLILGADTIVFILSPASAVSEICHWEVEEASRLGKRIIPIVCMPLGEAHPHPRIREINYIYFYPEPRVPGSGFWRGLSALDRALKVDIEWIRDGTRLAEMAERWAERGKSEDLLLRGMPLAEYLNWKTRRPESFAPLPDLHREFLETSKTVAEKNLLASTEKNKREEKQRRSKRRFALVSTSLFAASVAAGVALLAADLRSKGRTVFDYDPRIVALNNLLSRVEEIKEKYQNDSALAPLILTYFYREYKLPSFLRAGRFSGASMRQSLLILVWPHLVQVKRNGYSVKSHEESGGAALAPRCASIRTQAEAQSNPAAPKITALACSPGAETWIAAYEDGAISVHRQGATEIVVLSDRAIKKLGFLPGNEIVVAAGDDGYLWFYDTAKSLTLPPRFVESTSITDMVVDGDTVLIKTASYSQYEININMSAARDTESLLRFSCSGKWRTAFAKGDVWALEKHLNIKVGDDPCVALKEIDFKPREGDTLKNLRHIGVSLMSPSEAR